MAKSKPPLAVIAGPTASGKSALALALAERTGGIIVNADASQLYRNIPILSAAPGAADRARAHHRLFGWRDGNDPCSAAEWASRAKAEIAAIHEQGRQPILVGGTGLYLRTLLDGIAPVPDIDPAIRSEVRAEPVEANHARLSTLDPTAAATLHASDTARIARALEVVLSTGRTLAAWQSRRDGGIGDRVTLHPLILLPPRDWLYRRCDRRFAEMVEGGAIDEVRSLLARELDPRLPVMRAIGVREIGAFLSGAFTLDEAIAAGQKATRNYAKRQYTWFAHQPPAEWPRSAESPDRSSIDDVLDLLMAKA